MPVKGLKTAKIMHKLQTLAFFAIFRPIRDIKLLQKYFSLLEEVLSSNLVGQMW